MLPCRISNVGRSAPRSVLAARTRAVLLRADSCGAGHLGSLVYVGAVVHTVHTHVPDWLARASAGIFEFELLAELLGVILACDLAPGAPILYLCDNRGAVWAAIREGATRCWGA